MDQQGLGPRDLVPLIGSRARVSEVLAGKRGITMAMARALHKHLGIPAEALLQDSDIDLDDSLSNVEWTRFPLKAMARRGWISRRSRSAGPCRGTGPWPESTGRRVDRKRRPPCSSAVTITAA